MSTLGIQAKFAPLIRKGFADLDPAIFILVGALSEPARIIKFQNTTDQDVVISTNGIDDHDLIPAKSFSLYDLTTNHTETGGDLEISSGTPFYAQPLDAPSEGSIFITTIYASTH